MTVRKLLPLLALLLAAGCAGTAAVEPPVSVEGEVTVRGAEPFTGVWLETEMATYYVLVLDADDRAALVTPATYRVTGRVYRADWNGRPMAHLAVSSIRRVER